MAEQQGLQLDVRTPDNKLLVQSSPRPIGTYACTVCEGDNTISSRIVGGGQSISYHHHIGDSTSRTVYVDYNTVENRTYMCDGIGMWSGTDFDVMYLDIVPSLTKYTPAINTYFNLYEDYLILPAAGNGNIDILPQDIQLVEVPYNLDKPSERQSAAFWNATYNTETHLFENINPAPLGDGQYNMFGAEVVFQRPVCLTLLGDHILNLQTNDIAELAHGIRMRFSFNTVGVDHEWKMALSLSMFRDHASSF